MITRILMALLLAATAGGLLISSGFGEAAAETRALRATRAEVAEFCRGGEALLWGNEEITSDRSSNAKGNAYGCISNQGWIRCDQHGNCAGGDGAGNRLEATRTARSNMRN